MKTITILLIISVISINGYSQTLHTPGGSVGNSPNGNVGIGTSSPTNGLLHVFKNATTGNWGSVTPSNSAIRIQDSGSSLYIDGNTLYSDGGMNLGSLTNSSLTLGTNNSERLRISGDGKIGIGTTPSEGLLHIYRNETTGGIGSVTTANAGLKIQDSGSSLYIDGNTLYTNGNMILGTLSNTTFSIGTNNQERFRVSSNGSVGIGTTTPSERLEVNGTIRSKEVKVEATGWPDYVFKEDYPLQDLSKLKEYITINKHLPNIPTETEVKDVGINLGEMNAKLLQKIEELTLYIIQQQEQLDEQRILIGQLIENQSK